LVIMFHQYYFGNSCLTVFLVFLNISYPFRRYWRLFSTFKNEGNKENKIHLIP